MVFHAYLEVSLPWFSFGWDGWVDGICDEIDSFVIIEVKNELDQFSSLHKDSLVVIDINAAGFRSNISGGISTIKKNDRESHALLQTLEPKILQINDL